MLMKYCGLHKASQWSLRYNIPKNRLPWSIWEMQQRVDMEWQPTFGCISTQQVALIQLAVLDQVFLLDLCVQSNTSKCLFILLSLPFLLSSLSGYGMSGDLKSLIATWHQLIEEPLKMEAMLDLLNVHQKIQRRKINRTQNGPQEVLVGKNSAEKGLSLLVQQVLGRPLDKTEQMSHWEKRPLRISQIRYYHRLFAHLWTNLADAYCLLDVYSALSSNPAYFGLPADLRSISSSQPEKSGTKKQAHGKEVRKKGLLCGEKCSEDIPPLPPQQLRVVCDNMLQGLGRYLRCLGVDVIMLENTDDHRVAAKLAQAEGRFILTCGQPFQSLRSQVGEGRCLSLDCSEKARDQAVRVLRHFNVQLTPSDIFSRCQACNSDQYAAVPCKDMEKLSHILTPSVTPEIPRYVQCQWAPLSGLDPDTLTFPGGAPIQLHAVPPALLPRIPLFYVCTRCGKVFWEGSHFGRVLSMFQDVLHITDEDTEADAAAQQN
uniref:Exonuclease 3'-5' domain containing 3 n=1 Tax=Cyclopterus lumpus TaxID=8103 RepID=A0A8C3AAL7_CYCLU